MLIVLGREKIPDSLHPQPVSQLLSNCPEYEGAQSTVYQML